MTQKSSRSQITAILCLKVIFSTLKIILFLNILYEHGTVRTFEIRRRHIILNLHISQKLPLSLECSGFKKTGLALVMIKNNLNNSEVF